MQQTSRKPRIIEFEIEGVRIRYEAEINNGHRRVAIQDGEQQIATDWIPAQAKPTRKNAEYLAAKHTQYIEIFDGPPPTIYINLNLWDCPQQPEEQA